MSWGALAWEEVVAVGAEVAEAEEADLSPLRKEEGEEDLQLL